MKAIYKLNDKLSYSTQINNRNVVAAICAQEFDQILKYTTTYAEKKLIEGLIQFCLREIHSHIPMKLFQVDELLENYGEHVYQGIKPTIVIENIEGVDGATIDLSNYYTRKETDILLSRKQDELIAGENVEIDDDVISVDLSGIEGGGGSVDVYNTYGDSTTGAISQNFFTEEVKSNTEDIAALEAAVFPFTINYFRGGATFEKGSSQQVTLSWDYDRDIDKQYINGIEINNELRSKLYHNVSNNITYTLRAESEGQVTSSSVSVKFNLRKYWGVSKYPQLMNDEIIALNSDWASRAMGSTVFDCTGGKYVYYVIPTSMTNGIEFWINGLQNTDWNTEEIRLTNASGYTENYTIFRLNIIQTGVLKIEVK